MIIGSCSAAGLFINKGLKDRISAIKSFVTAFQIVKSEIIFRALPLGDIMRTIEAQCKGAAAEYFVNVHQEMGGGRRGFWPACGLWLHTLRLHGLTEGDIGIISGALQALGRYDGATQAEMITKACTALEQELEIARQELGQKGRLFRAMGVTVGIMIALVVI